MLDLLIVEDGGQKRWMVVKKGGCGGVVGIDEV